MANFLGGFIHQFGWCFFAFGMIFILVFLVFGGALEGFRDGLKLRGDITTVKGKVKVAEETGASVNETDVVRYFYEYSQDGQTLEGQCYVMGWKYDEGQRVDVEYATEHPEVSRIKGSRLSQFPIWVGLLIAIFPGVGLAMVLATWKGNVRTVDLLRRGRVAYGTLVSTEDTGGRINEEPIMEYTFKFKADSTGREHMAKTRTHDGSAIEDEEEEPILYLPSNPDYAVVFDNLPGSVDVDQRGQLRCKSPASALTKLIFPVLGGGQLAYFLEQIYEVFAG